MQDKTGGIGRDLYALKFSPIFCGRDHPGTCPSTQLFPAALEVPEDADLLARWSRMMKLREEIYRALELARAEKRIGSALESCVVIDSPDAELIEFLRRFGDELRFLLITSAVEFGPVGDGAFHSESIPGLRVEVRRADGTKCARCWNVTTDVGTATEWPEICARCATNVRQILAEAQQQ